MPRRLIVALTLLGLVGCSRTAHVEEDREVLYRSDAIIAVQVVNRSQLDATIYLLHDGARERLGTVTAATTANYSVRTRMLASGDFALLADPIGATRTWTTERLSASQGSEFVWTLESDFSRSAVLVRD
jgi:hypothetical protein